MSIAVAVVALQLVFTVHPDPRLRAGVMMHDAGKYAEAIKMYRDVLKDRPHDAAAVYELAFSMVEHKEYDAAIALIDHELASAVTQTPRLYVVKARAWDARGDLASAEAALRKGLEQDPGNPELAYNLGVNLATRERWPEAVAAFKACASADPGNPGGWWGLGRTYEAQQQSGEAVVAYARAAMTGADRNRVKAAAERVVALSPDSAALVKQLESADTYFSTARDEGHLEALAYDLRRAGGDAAAAKWCAENKSKVDAFRTWARSR